jgi:hypothetical protein
VIDHGYAQFIGKVAAGAQERAGEDRQHRARPRVERRAGEGARPGGRARRPGASAGEAAKPGQAGPEGLRSATTSRTPLSGLEQLFLDMSKRAQLAGLVRTLGPAAALLGEDELERVRASCPGCSAAHRLPVRAVAHCFCGL